MLLNSDDRERQLIASIQSILTRQRRVVVSLGGESGTGKSCLARAVAEAFPQETFVLGLDDYFRLPPRKNHAQRMADAEWVGLGEVDLDRLQLHVDAFVAGATELTIPQLDRAADCFHQIEVGLGPVRILVVEGTYATRLRGVDLRVFIDGDPTTTEAARRDRGRDVFDEATVRALEVEHRLLRPERDRADLVLPVR